MRKQNECKKARVRLGVRMRRQGAKRYNRDNRQSMPSCERVAGATECERLIAKESDMLLEGEWHEWYLRKEGKWSRVRLE